jgi:ferric-dicitrate binding protein FerR (iron transport regulator)
MNQPNQESDPVATLLRRAGRREQPSAEAMERVRAATRAAWQADLRRRGQRRYWLAAAASVALAAVGAGLWLRGAAPRVIVAQVTRGLGDLQLLRDGEAVSFSGAVAEVRSEDELRVAGASGLVLQTTGGLTLRIAPGTRLRWREIQRMELLAGRVYVDNETAETPQTRLAIVTSLATVQHVGTRFVVQTDGGQLRVAVRDGRVSVTPRRGAALQLERGDVLEALADGQLRQFEGAFDDADWTWVDALAPATLIDGRMLYDVLDELAHQGGLQLRFVTSEVELAARSLPLNGRPLQLGPRASLAAILAATPFEAAINGDELLIRPRP